MKKIVAIGGNRFDQKPLGWETLQLLLYGWSSWYDLAIDYKHEALAQFSRLIAEMPIIPSKYTKQKPSIDDSYRPFRANDGMVPLISALFLKPGSGHVFNVDNNGNLTYSQKTLSQYCLAGKTYLINGSIDHLDFLDNADLISIVIKDLKGL
jgi:hypothetical protein